MITNNIIEDLFGVKNITLDQFQDWSKFLSENYLRANKQQGLTTGIEQEGLIVGPQDVNHPIIQAFFQRFQGHFNRLNKLYQTHGCYSIEDTIQFTHYVPKRAERMDFLDYAVMLSKLMAHEENVRGNLGRETIHEREDLMMRRNEGAKLRSRDTQALTTPFFFSIDLAKETTTVYVTEYSEPTERRHLTKMLQQPNGPYTGNKPISFFSRFSTTIIPFFNVAEIITLDAVETHDDERVYPATKHTPNGSESIHVPESIFTL